MIDSHRFALAKPKIFGYNPGYFGGVAKRPKATVCKTVIRRFESGRRLFFVFYQLCTEAGTGLKQKLFYKE
jgi:hypothetical protein